MLPRFLTAILILTVACGSGEDPQPAASSEASMNFDLENLAPFLERVSGLVETGFGEAEIADLTAEVSAMALDDERQWSFSVTHAGQPTALQVRVFMGDIDAPDVAFFTSDPLAEAIRQELTAFAEALGI